MGQERRRTEKLAGRVGQWEWMRVIEQAENFVGLVRRGADDGLVAASVSLG